MKNLKITYQDDTKHPNGGVAARFSYPDTQQPNYETFSSEDERVRYFFDIKLVGYGMNKEEARDALLVAASRIVYLLEVNLRYAKDE